MLGWLAWLSGVAEGDVTASCRVPPDVGPKATDFVFMYIEAGKEQRILSKYVGGEEDISRCINEGN